MLTPGDTLSLPLPLPLPSPPPLPPPPPPYNSEVAFSGWSEDELDGCMDRDPIMICDGLNEDKTNWYLFANPVEQYRSNIMVLFLQDKTCKIIQKSSCDCFGSIVLKSYYQPRLKNTTRKYFQTSYQPTDGTATVRQR